MCLKLLQSGSKEWKGVAEIIGAWFQNVSNIASCSLFPFSDHILASPGLLHACDLRDRGGGDARPLADAVCLSWSWEVVPIVSNGSYSCYCFC